MSMMGPLKRTGFKQGIREQSSTRLETIGTLRITQDGRKFRYAKNGASALAAGDVVHAAAINSNHYDETLTAAAVGSKQVTITVTAGTAITQNDLQGGYLCTIDGDGEGYLYPIQGNSAIDASGTVVVVDLEVPILVAFSTSEASLVHSPWLAVVPSATEEQFPAGVAPIAVTASYYFWCQTGGLAAYKGSGTEAVATMMVHGATTKTLKAIPTTLDVDMPIVGIQYGMAAVSGEYTPVWLQID